MIIVFLANGFEEIEALTTVDILRRAGLSVRTVGIGGRTVTGAHGITVQADADDSEPLPSYDQLKAVVLPGGLPGTTNLAASEVVTRCVTEASAHGVLLCAICAAPSVLGNLGLLNSKRATCYPGYEDQLLGAAVSGASVAADAGVITAKGAGVTVAFALAIVSHLVSPEKAQEIGDAMQCR